MRPPAPARSVSGTPVSFTSSSKLSPSTISSTHQAVGRHVDHRQIGVDAIHARHTGQGIGAPLDDLALPLLGQVLHHHEHPLGADGEVHCAAHGRNRIRLAGMPVGEIARDRHLERAQHAEVQMPAAHHPEGIRVVEVAASGQQGHGLLARVDQVGILLARRRALAPCPARRSRCAGRSRGPSADGSPPASATRCPGSRRRPRGCRAPRAPPSGHGSFCSRCAPLPKPSATEGTENTENPL